MKRSILALALILVLSASVGCTKHRQYTTDGTVITEDGNKWDYDTDTINGDGIAVVVRFDNNGTMIDITDDIILSINYKEYPC